MVPLRVASLLLALPLFALSAAAQVKLTVRPDGKKVIYNDYSSRGRTRQSNLGWLAKQRNRPSAYDEIIRRHADSYGVDPVLAKAVIQVESNYNAACVSNKGARGLMQLMPGTARRFKVEKIHDPEQNIRGGVEYLSLLQKLFRHDLPRVLAAYNAGENAVLKYGGIPPYRETQTYVQRALTVYYGRPYGGGAISFAGGPVKTLAGGFAFRQPRKPALARVASSGATRRPTPQSGTVR